MNAHNQAVFHYGITRFVFAYLLHVSTIIEYTYMARVYISFHQEMVMPPTPQKKKKKIPNQVRGSGSLSPSSSLMKLVIEGGHQ
jgi:hypothetical protein